MEPFEKRLTRYISQEDLEILGWQAVNLQNTYLRELQDARERQL